MKRQRKKMHNKSPKIYLLTKMGAGLVLLILMVGNILVFAKSMSLSDNIITLEKDIAHYRKDNQELLKKTYAHNSLISLEYAAKELGFSKKAEPVFFEKPHYAMVQ